MGIPRAAILMKREYMLNCRVRWPSCATVKTTAFLCLILGPLCLAVSREPSCPFLSASVSLCVCVCMYVWCLRLSAGPCAYQANIHHRGTFPVSSSPVLTPCFTWQATLSAVLNAVPQFAHTICYLETAKPETSGSSSIFLIILGKMTRDKLRETSTFEEKIDSCSSSDRLYGWT